MERHADYDAGKHQSNGSAAMRVVLDMVKPRVIDEIRARIDRTRPAVIAPVIHHDIGRRTNELPVAYAEFLKAALGLDVDLSLTKESGAANTDVSVADRMANVQKFVGPVRRGVQYVVVDDNWTSGDMLVALIDHILSGGGEVVAISTIAASQSQNYVRPRQKDIDKLLARTGVCKVTLKCELGFPIENFTGSELYRIVNLTSGWRGVEGFLAQIPDRGRATDQSGSEGGTRSSEGAALAAQPAKQPTEAEVAHARKVYSKLWDVLERNGKLAPDQWRVLERHEAVLGQKLLFDLDAAAPAAPAANDLTLDALNPDADVFHADNATIVGPGQLTLFAQRAYHGTPHKINLAEGFRLAKIGTGEGAQVYGWGLYFAEIAAVADTYRKGLTENEFIRKVQEVYNEYSTPEEAVEMMKAIPLSEGQRELLKVLEDESWWGFDYPHQAVSAALREPENFDPSPEFLAALAKFGQLYTVELDVEPGDLLDWNKPLSEQSEKVQNFARTLKSRFNITVEIQHGNDLYEWTKQAYGDAKAASKALLAAGIPGIRYLDGASRTGLPQWGVVEADGPPVGVFRSKAAAEAAADQQPGRVVKENPQSGTYNYVIFDESKIKITAENGQDVTGEVVRYSRQSSSPADQATPFSSLPKHYPQSLATVHKSTKTAPSTRPSGFPQNFKRSGQGWKRRASWTSSSGSGNFGPDHRGRGGALLAPRGSSPDCAFQRQPASCRMVCQSLAECG